MPLSARLANVAWLPELWSRRWLAGGLQVGRGAAALQERPDSTTGCSGAACMWCGAATALLIAESCGASHRHQLTPANPSHPTKYLGSRVGAVESTACLMFRTGHADRVRVSTGKKFE